MKSLSYQKVLKKKAKAKKRSKKRRAVKRKIKRQNNLVQDCVSFHFPTAMSGNSYWQNYANVFRWQKNYNNFIYYHNYSPVSFGDRRKKMSIISPRRNNESRQSYWSEQRNLPAPDDKTDDESENEYVVTEEMMKFLEISMRHKQERELNKEKDKLNKQKTNENNKVAERDNIEECQAPKEKTVDAVRMQEMNELYGNSAAMIMGMETALQLTFNRNCDLHKPSYWPVLSLNLKF